MAEPDTEITLGTGKMLVLFFGLVALCSAFFALGYKLGRGSGGGVETTSSPTVTSPVKSPAIKPAANPSTDATPTQTSAPQTTTSAAPPPDSAAKPSDAGASPAPTPADATPAPPANYYVQVAAVTKQEDAEALVDALKKKQYAAFAMTMADKLIHVQVGPFGNINDAETTRAKLVNDGYNPILKK